MLLIVFILLISLQGFAESHSTHTVRDKECLSQIAYHYCRKVYGKNGFIKQIKKLNPQLNKKPNLVIPGTSLSIPSLKLCQLPWPMDKNEERPTAGSVNLPTENHVSEREKSNDDYFVGASLSYKFLGSTSIIDANSVSYKRIEGVSLISKPILGLDIGRRFDFSAQTRHMVFAGIKFEDYYGSRNVSVSSSSILRTNLGLGIDHQFSDSHTLILTAGAEERTIIDKSVYSQINLSKVLVPFIGAKHFYLLKENLKQKTQLLSYARYLSESKLLDLKVKNGYELGLGISYKLLKNKVPNTWLINIGRLEQSTSVTHQTEWQFGLTCTLDIPDLKN